MRRVLAALALSFALPAAAQAPPDSVAWQRFFPAAAGDEWQYRVVRTCLAGDSPWCQGTEYVTRWEVVGDTLVDGTSFVIFAGGRPGQEGHCAAGVLPGDLWLTVREVAGSPFQCPVGAAGGMTSSFYRLAEDVPYAPVSVSVGEQSYTVDAVLRTGPVGLEGYDFAADIGLHRHAIRQGTGRYETSTVSTLHYARVGGVIYGSPLVAGEPGPTRTSPALVVRPNPASSSASVTLSLPAQGTGRLTIVDVLGRAVLSWDLGAQPAGATEHALDLSTLAPGVYVLRARTADGVVTRPFVRAD